VVRHTRQRQALHGRGLRAGACATDSGRPTASVAGSQGSRWPAMPPGVSAQCSAVRPVKPGQGTLSAPRWPRPSCTAW
jgi:hypothetical protein